MKKIIVLMALATLMFSGVACGSDSSSKNEEATITMLATIQRIDAGEDCWYNADKTVFYMAAGRDEGGRPTTVYAYRIVN